MKFLLVAKFSEVEPLGIQYLASALQHKGHEIDYFIYRDQESLFFDFDDALTQTKPDVVGFSSYTGNHKTVYTLSDIARGYGIKTAIGGPHATYFWEDCTKHADYVFRGEALVSFPELKPGIPPLLPVELIPHPEREKFYATSEFHKNNRIKNMFASFGCPYSCNYCVNSNYKSLYPGYKVRIRKVNDVLEETNAFECELIFFQDDYFGFNIQWLEEFVSKWNGRPYHCQIRLEGATPYRLGLLRKSNCTGVTTAIECVNEEVRMGLLGRKITDKKIFEALNNIKDSGLKLRTEQMLGIPETTIEDEMELLRWNISFKPDLAWVSIYQPYRGTVLGEYCVEKGYYQGNNDDIGGSFFEATHLNFNPERKRFTERLQKVFHICAHIPEGDKLAVRYTFGDEEDIGPLIRKHLYAELYKV